MLEKLKNKEWVKELISITILAFLFFGVNIYLCMATDTYWSFTAGFKAPALDMYERNGRIVIAILYGLHYLSKLPAEYFYYISSFLAMLFLILSIWLYESILKRYIDNYKLRVFISFICIANIFIIEYFMFIEKGGFLIAIFCNVVASYFFEKLLRTKKKRNAIWAAIALIVAVFSYQGTIALFVVLSIPFAYKYAKNAVSYIGILFVGGGIYLIAALACVLGFRFLFMSNRMIDNLNLLANFKYTVEGTWAKLISTFDVLPHGFYICLVAIIFMASICAIIANKEKIVFQIINTIIIVLAVCLFSTASILQSTGVFIMRIIYPLGGLLGAMLVNFYVNCVKSEQACDEKISIKLTKTTICGIILCLLVCQYLSYNKIFIDKYKVNCLDEYRYNIIGQAIAEYQENTGNVVTKVAFYEDADASYPSYPGLFFQNDLIVSAIYCDWSNVAAMTYYLGTGYGKIEKNEYYEAYFKSRDWDRYSGDQLIFDGDTLHICVY